MRLTIKAHVLGLANASLVALLAPPTSAQDALGNASQPTAGVTSSAANSLNVPDSPFDPSALQSDVIFGRNVKGPYPLSWKKIRPGSETVIRDGGTLHRDVDYTVDADQGLLAFTTPLLPDQVVRISYRNDTPDATPNKNALIVPVQLNFWQQGQNRLTLISKYRPDDPKAAAKNETLDTALQFNYGTRLWAQSALTSGVYMDLHGGDWLGRSGLLLADKTKLALGEINLAYKRAGAQFAPVDGSGLDKGREVMEATGAFNPLRRLTLNTTLRQTTELLDSSTLAPNDPTKGTTTREAGAAIALALPGLPGKIDAGRTETETLPADGSRTLKTSDTLHVEKTVAKGTKATVGYEAVTTAETNPDGSANTAGGNYSQKTSLEVKQQVADALSLQGTFQNQIGSSGGQDTTGLKLEANPFVNVKRLRDLKVSAALNDKYQDSGAQHSREATLELPVLPLFRTKLSGGFRQSSAPGKELTVGLMDANAHPLRYLEISGGVRLRDGIADNAPDPNAVNTYNLKFKLSPLRALQLTGSYSRNPESDGGDIKNSELQSLGLESQIGFLTFRGQYGIENQYLTTRLSNNMNLALDLHLTRADTLTTGYQNNLVFDKDISATTIYQLSFTHKLGSLFDFSLNGTMTQYGQNGLVNNDKTELKGGAKFGVKF